MRCTVDQYDYAKIAEIPIQPKHSGSGAGRIRHVYKDIIAAFDIETTVLEDVKQSIMYVWCLQLNDDTIIGRTWKEFKRCLINISKHLGGARLCIFVHNLSYEFVFLSGIFKFESKDVFALDKRRVAKAVLKCNKQFFEFRCSYIHSNMSLDQYTKKMRVEHVKMSGDEFNYSKKRYPWTELTPKELDYACTDVVGLVEAIKVDMQSEGDDLYTFPLTSTGYVRRDMKRAMHNFANRLLNAIKPTIDLWRMLREAFRGANTHANRFFAGMILSNVRSYDRVSSYLDIICNCKFPMSEFTYIGDCTEAGIDNLIKKGKALLFRIRMDGVELIDEFWGCPYIPIDKCRKRQKIVNDNGRVLSAGHIEMTITDVDWQIIKSEYKIESIEIYDVYYAKYGYLPKPIIEQTIKYYTLKTELKNIEGQEVYYDKSKNKANSIFGMMAQNPVKQDIIYDEDCEGLFRIDNANEEVLLDKYNRKAFLAYQWGVWITAWGRMRLEEGVRLAGDGFVYTDTDSVKSIDDIDFEEYNAIRVRESKKSGAYAQDSKANTYYMGVFDQEHTYDRFITLGAKKYAFEIDGKFGITIAGVSKKKGAQEMGCIENFKEGFTFRDSAGLQAIYNDNPEIKSVTIEGRKISITRNVCLLPSMYTLGITADYSDVIQTSRLFYQKYVAYNRYS